MKSMVPPIPQPQAEVAIWRYKDLRPLLIEACDLVTAEEAERRVLMLINPALSMFCMANNTPTHHVTDSVMQN